MKKKIIKNFLVICIVFVFSINTLAVVISDNDGSGFITKPEFDTLKSSFQAQLDSFNNSIDNKIDTAIASYLDGIVLSDTDEYGIIMDWKNVLFINETKAPEFRLPNYVCMYGFTGESHVADTNLKIFSQAGKLFYKPTAQWGTNETCRRPLFGVLSGSEKTGVTKLYWDGIALRYNETYNLYIEKIEGYDDLVNLDLGDSDVHGLKFNNVFKLSYNGYAADLTVDTFYNPSIVYYYAGGSTKNANNHMLNQKYITTEITIDDWNNKTKEYEHIIQYNGNSSWRLSNIDFKNTFCQHLSNTNTAEALYNKINSLGASNMIVASCYIAAYDPSPTVSGTVLKRSEGEMANAQYVNDSSILSSIGMLSANKKANEIYQLDKDNKKFNVKKDTYDVNNVTLQSGFQLCAAPENSTVEWEADFSEVYCYNGSSYVTNANEVDIYLSYVPFSDLTDSSDYIKWQNGGTTQNYITTTGRKATLKWKQGKKSLVYIKCVPHFTGTSYIDNNWHINLDLTGKSKSFKVTSAD